MTITSGTGSRLTVEGRSASQASLRYGFVEFENVGVFFREAGRLGAPTILLLHGFPSSSSQFETLIPLLAERFHVVAPDYPGFGLSGAPSPDAFAYTFDHLADTVDKLVRALSLDRYVLFMNDYGGPVGFRLAIKHPERVAGMIVQNAVVHEEGLSAGWAVRRRFWADRETHEVQVVAAFTAPESFGSRHVGASPRPERYDPSVWAREENLMARAGQKRLQADLCYDYRENVAAYPEWQAWLREHRPPLLVLWGKYDTAFTVAGATAFLREVPEAEVHILNAGHFATEEEVEQIAELTQRFLAKVIAP